MRTAICFIFFMVMFFHSIILRSCSATINPHQNLSLNITTDESALLSLKSHIISDPHHTLTSNWSVAKASYCNWVGVICSTSNKRVVALNLSTMGLIGTIPPQIGNLSFLVSLDLSNNSFSGSIPITIFTISTLRVIDFTNNSLSGNLPVDICHGIPKIEGLHLSLNKLSGPIPSALHECSKLKVLSLLRNEFSGSIPREIGNLSMLEVLDFGQNYLEGIIPQEIGSLWNMKHLSLNYNNLSGIIPETIFNLSKLEVISIFDNHLSGKLPSNFGHKQPNLRKLLLGTNRFTGILPDSISNATQLDFFDVSGNNFTGIIPKSLGNLALVEFLGFGSNNFINEKSFSELSFLNSLTNCRKLTVLILDDNPLNGYLPVSIGNFSTALEQLYASECGIKGTFPNEIGNLTSLRVLSLHGNELIGKIPITIKRLSKLQELYLLDNKIEGSIPYDLCLLRNLGYLTLLGNQISGPIPACLGDISSLRYLDLSSNRLNSSLPVNIGNLKDILQFNVSKNSLSGHLPSELGNLKVAVLIDLSHNQFSGNIPSSLGSLQNLVSLSLANNRLQGPIPDSFKYSVSLENLDLSHNNLSGVIPKSLEALIYLRSFNASSNSLRGEIPSEGPFKNFTNQSFLGNEALCGASRFQVAKCRDSVARGSRKRRVLVIVGISLVIILIVLIILIFAFVLISRKSRRSVSPQVDMLPITTCGRISLYELHQATDGFSESNVLGIGSFGTVYRGALVNGRIVAIKVFNSKLEGGFKSFDVECEVLRNLRHRNLGKVISTCSNFDFKALVLEYMPNGSLEKWLYSHNHFLDLLQRIDIMIDVACALDYLHYGYSSPVVHCDLKPSNVLLDNDMVAHLSDFGVAKLLGEGESIAQTMTLATFGYIAPEYGLEGLVSKKCDVYSYGIMLIEVFTRIKPNDEQFLGDLSMKQWVNNSLPKSVIEVIDANLLLQEDEQITAKVDCLSSIMELALSCCADSPEDRFTMRDVLAALRNIRIDFLQFLANHERT